MWTSSLNNLKAAAFLASAILAGAGALAAPVDHLTVFLNPDPPGSAFIAGESTNTATSAGVILISAFGPGFSTPDPGETITLELLKPSGEAVPGGIYPPSFVTKAGVISYGTSLEELPITFFYAGTALRIRATPAIGLVGSDESSGFIVVPATAARLLVLTDGLTPNPGHDPVNGPGYTGTPMPQPFNTPINMTVQITDNFFNPVTTGSNASDVVHFDSGDLIILPLDGPLSSGTGSFQATITASRIARLVTVSDVTDPGILSGSVVLVTAGPEAEEIFPYPNPFNPRNSEMTFQFQANEATTAAIKVRDAFGQGIWQREFSAAKGVNTIQWDGRNDNGQIVASGFYYVILEIDGSVKSKKKLGVIK